MGIRKTVILLVDDDKIIHPDPPFPLHGFEKSAFDESHIRGSVPDGRDDALLCLGFCEFSKVPVRIETMVTKMFHLEDIGGG